MFPYPAQRADTTQRGDSGPWRTVSTLMVVAVSSGVVRNEQVDGLVEALARPVGVVVQRLALRH